MTVADTSLERVIPMRRLGSSVIHLVDIDPTALVGMSHLGTVWMQTSKAPCVGTTEPVVTICGSTLRGVTVWMQTSKKACTRCTRWSGDAEVVSYPNPIPKGEMKP